MEGCIAYALEVQKRPIVHWLPEEKLWTSRGKRKAAFPVVSFALTVLSPPQTLELCVTCHLWIHRGDSSTGPLLSQGFVAGSADTSSRVHGMTPRAVEWAPAGRGQKLWHENRPVRHRRWQPRTPRLEPDLIILERSDLHPSQLVSSLHEGIFEEAGSGARVHG